MDIRKVEELVFFLNNKETFRKWVGTIVDKFKETNFEPKN